ncbi:uncharacterized protein LOC116304162 isoform X2 [Actinia tenebrosa]|uniref:Uncharacterized protein LOC116304162 isoform X2 n=1 Tax=Actinia tenebrosa TaxID=6105 RepID=A0A6P8ITZ8_ACTTE|nr:uncharacterized protein LOC116304162 isoform X2 [Actinia tenebrosa]
MALFKSNAVSIFLVFYGFSCNFLPSTSNNLEVCNLCRCYNLFGLAVVNCSSSGVPKIIPDEAKYLDLSNNGISSLRQHHIEAFKNVEIIDLTNNPLNCDCHLALSIKELTSASSVVKGKCSRPTDLAGVNIDHIYLKITPCNFSGSTHVNVISQRVRRSSELKQCIPGTPDCAYVVCGGWFLWLPTTTHWGCCNGVIHNLTSSYCEANMGVRVKQCTKNDFRCNNQHCLPRYWVCNDYNDCQDGSDQVGCLKCGNSTLHFQCKNGNCIDKNRVCDTYNDCGDGSDEMFCRFSFMMGWCGSMEYRCPNERCVSGAKLCDGRNDCGDDSDEQGCFKDSSKKCPDGWTFLNQRCYKIEYQLFPWSTAQATCASNGGHLTKITSQEEEDTLKNLITSQHSGSLSFWIGLSRGASQGFQWTDSVAVGKYTSWEYGEPSVGKNCVSLINNTMKWRAENCDLGIPFICTRDSLCKHNCQNKGTCQSSRCVCAADWSGEDCSFKFPNITSLDDIDIKVLYNSNISLSCQSTGVPRPNVEWLVNEQAVAGQRDIKVFNEPFITNITIHVKSNTEMRCTSKNRGGLDSVRIRVTVEDDDVVNVKAIIRLWNMKYDKSLENPLSGEYQALASRLTYAISSLYQNKLGYKGLGILSFRPGSLTCEVLVRFSKNSEEELTRILKDAINSGMIANLTVDSKYLALEKKNKACPPDFFNVTWFASLPSNIRVQRCPHGSIGTARRRCSENGQWEHPDYTQCVTQDILDLKHRMDTALNKTTPSPSEIQSILDDLVRKSHREKGDAKIAGDIKTCTQILKEVVDYNTKHTGDTETNVDNIRNFLSSASNLLDYENKQELVILQESDNITSLLIYVLEGFGLQAAGGLETSASRTKQYVADNLVMGITLVSMASPDDVTFPNYTDQHMTSRSEWNSMLEKNYIVLPKSTFDSNNKIKNKVSRVSSFLYRTLSTFLNIPSAYSKVGDEFLLSSNVISASIKPSVSLRDPVKTIYGKVQDPDKPLACVFWDFSLNSKKGAWSRDGCSLSSRDGSKITCECNHLTNFAVLMDISNVKGHEFPLRIISSVGCAVSLLGLVITLFVHFIFWRNLKSEKTIIHVNLCVALLTANIILLAGLESTKYKSLCTAVAVLLHYFFLCALAWMLVEGIQIYVAIVMVFQFERKRKYFYLIGWGTPLMIVGISMAVTQMKGYGGENACWLSSDGGLIFAFIGPVLAVVLVNIIIFILVMRAMMTTHKMISADEIQKARVAGKCCAVLLPLLGLTWLFGVLAIDSSTVVFLYLFAIFNSLQGFFIFIFHCLLDLQVQTAVKSWSVKRERTESNLGLRALSSSSNPSNRLDTRTSSAASTLPTDKRRKNKSEKDNFDTVVV